MSRSRIRRPFQPHYAKINDGFAQAYHDAGQPAPWARVRSGGRDVTTLPVGEWPESDQLRYAEGWRPDRFGDDPATIPASEW